MLHKQKILQLVSLYNEKKTLAYVQLPNKIIIIIIFIIITI